MFQITLACTNLKRQFRKSSLVFILCAVMVCFLCSYVGNIQVNQDQLTTLPQVIPVSAYISNLNGSLNVGLQISGTTLDGIEASGFATDMVCTVQTAANFAPETTEQRIKWKKIMLAGVSALAAYPSIQPDGLNGEPDYFDGQSAQCIVNRYFMENNGLSVGDEITLAIYRWTFESNVIGTLQYEYLAERSLTITDSFDSQVQAELSVVPNIVCPIGWMKTVFAENGVEFYADSASFSLKDPAYLNEFKLAMKELKLLPVNPQAAGTVSGNALAVNDETFIRSATSLRNNLLILRLFLPILIAAMLLAGYVISHLMIQSRRSEFAVMRSLGVGKSDCLVMFLIESAILALSGGLFGAFAALLFAGVYLSVSLAAAASFFAAYMLGVFAAVLLLGRVSVINMLTKTD